MRDWAEKAARLCERWYPRINEVLASEGYRPRHHITMKVTTTYDGVAAASGGEIIGSTKYFKDHRDDVGAMIHETTHIVQNYKSRGNPGWLVEGVADYIRFFLFEPGKIGPINAQQARYDGSYRTTAAFLAYVSRRYDKALVSKLNAAMREREIQRGRLQGTDGKDGPGARQGVAANAEALTRVVGRGPGSARLGGRHARPIVAGACDPRPASDYRARGDRRSPCPGPRTEKTGAVGLWVSRLWCLGRASRSASGNQAARPAASGGGAAVQLIIMPRADDPRRCVPTREAGSTSNSPPLQLVMILRLL